MLLAINIVGTILIVLIVAALCLFIAGTPLVKLWYYLDEVKDDDNSNESR